MHKKTQTNTVTQSTETHRHLIGERQRHNQTDRLSTQQTLADWVCEEIYQRKLNKQRRERKWRPCSSGGTANIATLLRRALRGLHSQPCLQICFCEGRVGTRVDIKPSVSSIEGNISIISCSKQALSLPEGHRLGLQVGASGITQTTPKPF